MIGVRSLTVLGNGNIKTVCVGKPEAVSQKVCNLADRGQDTALIGFIGRVGSARKGDGTFSVDQQSTCFSAVDLRGARHGHGTAADANTRVK